ncbi:MAG TPA: hypothetical protein VN626_03590 [Clostridia bacterium]|nr:hypothetical protein [Clostridia bacterium]
MNIYPEIKKIAGNNAAIQRLAGKLKDKLDCDGLNWQDARLIDGCTEKDDNLYKDGHKLAHDGLVDDDYYCDQYTGYCEDDFHGTLYFKTNVPGQFVAVPFECY